MLPTTCTYFVYPSRKDGGVGGGGGHATAAAVTVRGMDLDDVDRVTEVKVSEAAAFTAAAVEMCPNLKNQFATLLRMESCPKECKELHLHPTNDVVKTSTLHAVHDFTRLFASFPTDDLPPAIPTILEVYNYKELCGRTHAEALSAFMNGLRNILCSTESMAPLISLLECVYSQANLLHCPLFESHLGSYVACLIDGLSADPEKLALAFGKPKSEEDKVDGGGKAEMDAIPGIEGGWVTAAAAAELDQSLFEMLCKSGSV